MQLRRSRYQCESPYCHSHCGLILTAGGSLKQAVTPLVMLLRQKSPRFTFSSTTREILGVRLMKSKSILVCVTQISLIGLFDSVPEKEGWDRVMELNVKSVFYRKSYSTSTHESQKITSSSTSHSRVSCDYSDRRRVEDSNRYTD